jgi:hypothetical protein
MIWSKFILLLWQGLKVEKKKRIMKFKEQLNVNLDLLN